MFPILVSRTKNLVWEWIALLRMNRLNMRQIGLALPWLRRVWSDWFCPCTRFTPWGNGRGSGFTSQFLRFFHQHRLCAFRALNFGALLIGHVGDNDTNCSSYPAGVERFQSFRKVHPTNSLTFCKFDADILPNWCFSPRAGHETWWRHGVPTRPANWLFLSWVQ